MAIDTFWGNIFKFNHMQDTLSILNKIPLFQHLKIYEVVKISKILHARNYYQNEFVFQEKEPGAGMYIVKSGSVKIFMKSPDGKSHEVAVLKKGDFFGESALIDESPRSASAIALENTELLGFFRADLMNLMDRDPVLSAKILMRLAIVITQRLRQTNLALKQLQHNA